MVCNKDEPRPDIVYDDSYDRKLIRLYILADVLRDVALMNRVINECIEAVERSNELFTTTSVELLWDNTSEGSALRRLIVEYFAAEMIYEDFATKDWLVDFVIAVAHVCLRDREMKLKERSPSNKARSYYHEHSDPNERVASERFLFRSQRTSGMGAPAEKFGQAQKRGHPLGGISD